MQVKKFIAKDMQDALLKVKEELGSDAIVFGSRQIRTKGMFGPTEIEVTAAVDDVNPAAAAATAAGGFQANPTRDASNNDVFDVRLKTLRNEIRGLREDLRTEEFESAREMLVDQLEGVREILAAYSIKSVGGTQDWFTCILDSADVDPEFRQRIVARCHRRFERLAADDAAAAKSGTSLQMQAITEVMADILDTERYSGPARNKVVAVVGPTGAGKTTTLAKLAANASLIRKQKVGLITTDTYRVGAVDQLRHYADLIGVPLETVSTPEEFSYAMNRFARYDLVLVDTAGRNPGDNNQVADLRTMFRQYDVETHLVIPAATRQYEVNDILVRYHGLAPAALIFTKYDEARVFGAMVNAVMASDLPISFITMGQRVPEDITRPRPQAIARRIAESVLEFAGPSVGRTVETQEDQLTRLAG